MTSQSFSSSTKTGKKALVKPVDQWTPCLFAVKYRKQVRNVMVLAPFREAATLGVGNGSDEEVQAKPMDSFSLAVNRLLTRRNPKGNELERFYVEMERCLRSGLSEPQSLRLVAPLAKSPYFRGVISGLRHLVQKQGLTMSESMAQFPGAFDDVAIELKRAGEAGGKQIEVYGRLAARTAAARALQGKFKSALITPGITLVALTVAVVTMHFKILPSMEENFKEIRIGGSQLPAPTRFVVGISNFLHQNPVVYAVPVGLGLLAFYRRRQLFQTKWFQAAAVRVPFIGPAYRMLIMSRSLGALAMLESDGVPLDQCYQIAARVSGHVEYRDYFDSISALIQKGRAAQTAFLQERWRIGEEGADLAARMEVASTTGEIGPCLQNAALLMNEEAELRLDALPKLVGPLVTVLSAAVVGVLVLAIFLPTFSLLLSALKMGVKN